MIIMLEILAMPVFGLGLLLGMARLERVVDAGRGFHDPFPMHRHPHSP
jgi:hypothetical protein